MIDGDVTIRLQSKRALVTGAGRGIGAAIAEVLLEAGASVVINALTDSYLGPLVSRLGNLHGDRVDGIALDATSADGARQLVAGAGERLGHIDILVNALGDAVAGNLVSLPTSEEQEADDDQVEKMLSINLRSAIHCSRMAAPGMIERRWGRIINISSYGGAVQGVPRLAVYSAAKAGLIGLGRALAREWGPFGVTVNTIVPGVFPDPDTSTAAAFKSMTDRVVPLVPLGRVGRAREIGMLAAFLSSEAGAYMTGHPIVIDGGFTT